MAKIKGSSEVEFKPSLDTIKSELENSGPILGPGLFKVEVGKLVEICPGKSHGWFESNVGLIRKPLGINHEVV